MKYNPRAIQDAADDAREVAMAAWSAGATAAQAAANSAANAAMSVVAFNRAAFYAYTDASDALPTRTAADARAAFEAACSADLAKLARLKLGAFPERGDPIDPSENGPLGLLWPRVRPDWWHNPRMTETPENRFGPTRPEPRIDEPPEPDP